MHRGSLRWFSAVVSLAFLGKLRDAGCDHDDGRRIHSRRHRRLADSIFLMTFQPVARTSSSWASVTFTQYKLADVWAAPWTGSAKRAALIGRRPAVVTPAESRLHVIRSGAPDIYKHGDLPPSSLPSNIPRTITWARMGGRLCRLRSWLISIEKKGRGGREKKTRDAGWALQLCLPPEASPVVPPRRHGESLG